MKCAIYLLILMTALPVCAQEIPDNPGLCKQLEEARQQMKEQDLPNLKWAQLQLIVQKIFPSLSYRLQSMNGPRSSGKKSAEGRHVIVSFGVESQNQDLKEEFEEADAKMKRMTKLFLGLLRQKNIEACIKQADRIGFKSKEFFELRDTINKMTEVKQDREYREVLKYYGKLSGSLQEQWELKTGFHAAELKTLLDTKTIDHLVIVTHANDKGHITDSFGNYFPTGFFHGISSKIKTLSFFTCHGKKVVESFKLQTQGAGTKIFFPEAKSPLLSDVTLLSALPSFIKKVSKQIRSLNIPRPIMNEECSIEIQKGALGKGEISFLLGDKYLVAHYRDGEKRQFKFDCSLLKDEDMLSIRSLKFKEPLKLIEEWKILLKEPSGDREFESVTHFDENGIYQGSLYAL